MAEEKAKKKKRPTAQKRQIQDEKKREVNRVFKSRFRTTIRRFEDCLKNGGEIATALNEVYGMLDRCVKRGIFSVNKASRSKSRLAAKAARHGS